MIEDMHWNRVSIPTALAIVGVAARDDRTLVAGARSGEVMTIDAGATLLETRTILPRMAALARCGNDVYGLVGGNGVFVLLTANEAREDIVDREVALVAVTCGETGVVRVVGQYDTRTGAIFESRVGLRTWRRVAAAPGTPGLLSVSGPHERVQLLAGHRGYVGLWKDDQITKVQTRTDHPLRATVITASGRWFAGGGGWADDMPILLEGDGEACRPVITAPGNRVIVGLASDSASTVWIAENRSDGERWVGYVSRLNERMADEVVGRFDERLLGIFHTPGKVIVYGTSGLIAWVESP